MLKWSVSNVERFVILLHRHLQVAILSPMLLREAPGKFTFAAIPACILGVYLIARPQMETDHHKAHLHLAGIIVGLFQVCRLSYVSLCAVCVFPFQSVEILRWPAVGRDVIFVLISEASN